MQIDFKTVYKPPFKVADHKISAYSANGVNTFSAFSDKAQRHMSRIVDILNGTSSEKYNKTDVYVNRAELHVEDSVIIVRGWGYLTGNGVRALGLFPIEAAKVQDDFIKWVVNKITE